MDLVGVKVRHRNFGEGEITSVFTDSDGIKIIEVKYFNDSRTRRHPVVLEMPQIFFDILNVIDNDAAKQQITSDLKDYEYTKKLETRLNRTRSMNTHRSDDGNIAFRCEYCDGGSTLDSDYIGFNGLCSDKVREKNTTNHYRNCHADDNPCMMFVNGKISGEELQQKFLEDKESICYECHLMESWYFGAGFVRNGANQNGNANTIRPNVLNGLCILTTLEPDAHEASEQRCIFGVFIIDKVEPGEGNKEGKVYAHPDYRIVLTKSEAEKMPYWGKYYLNRNNEENKKWGPRPRYIGNDVALRILEDIKKLKQSNQEEATLIQEMILYYKHMNKKDINNDEGRENLNKLVHMIKERQ